MASSAKKTFWQRGRICFRWLRISVLLFVLLLVAALLYLNRIGLPDFVKQPVLEKLRARGFDLQFTRLRWRWDHGLVAENVQCAQTTNDVATPKFTARQMQLRINYAALFKRQFQVDGLVLREGNLLWLVTATNEPVRELVATNIQTEIRLLPGDLIALDDFQAQFAGVHLNLTGTITNASAVRHWKLFQGKPSVTSPGTLQARLRKLGETLEQIHFATPPQLKMVLRGDALDMQSFMLRLSLNTPDAETPWGSVKRGLFTAVLLPASNEVTRAEFGLRAATAQTPWASTTNLAFQLRLVSALNESDYIHATLELGAAFAQTKWGGATNIQLHVQSLHSLTNLLPLSGSGELRLADATTDWGRAQQLQLAATLAHSTNTLMDSSWAWWTNFAPFALNWDCRVSGVQSPKLQADEVFCAGQWLAPELKIDKLSAKLYRGTLDAKASLDVASREFSFSGASDFDAQKITPLLTPGARKWLSNYSWKTPPSASAEGTLVLPAWTNRQPDWRAEVQPTLRLSGQVHATDCAFRNVPVSTADTHFTYTNMVWRLPDITLTRPEGRMTLFHESNDRTKDYYFKINSAIDPGALRPLFQSNQWHAVELVTFSQPPAISGEIWGRWHDNERLNARAHVAITNFALRGQTASRLEATLEYTNKFLKVIEPRCYRGTQEMSAASVLIDFAGQRAFLTNGFGVVDPLPIARAIGPKIGRHIEPYRFYEPVAIHAEGVIPFRDEKVADLHFIVDGHSFEWWKFRVGHVSGKIDWVGQQLNLRDIVADFYRGTAVGAAEFDFKAKPGAEFSFNLVATDADIHLLAADLTGKTNKLEGRLTTRLDITRCYTTNWQNSVQGNGRANLRDGLIWDIPIFGIFSPVLDTIMPGLGNSRAREGSATFSIKNGVARSNDLEIQTMMARLQYHGTIDLQGNVNAYVEAEPLRNTWVVGPVISLALWPVSKAFEYKISGTLHKPESEPLFIPKFMFMPFHPVKTIKDLLPEDSNPQTETPSESP